MIPHGTRRVRYEGDLGEPGSVYEFDIRLPVIRGVKIDNEDFEFEAQHSLKEFERELRRTYTWIGQCYQTGRSGGWLAVEDKRGLATEAKLRRIMDKIDQAQAAFIRFLKSEYRA